MSLQISKQVARRFILGRQGLWPGRRCQGKKGIRQALHQVEALQIDPVTVLAQSHHLALWGRVLDFDPKHLDLLIYQDREFFDWGGALDIYPMASWPALKHHMQEYRQEKRWADFARQNQALIRRVLEEIKERGPLLKREIAGKRVESYRGTRDSGVALHYLFLIGQLMSFDRQGKQRRYELTERVLPAGIDQDIPAHEARRILLRKAVAGLGLAPINRIHRLLQNFRPQKLDREKLSQELEALMAEEFIQPVIIEGNRRKYFILSEDEKQISTLMEGRLPAQWQVLETSTQEEAVFLSPLEYASARGRAAEHFDFDYIWEIYKKADQRKYGPYTLPILFGDSLVARIDMKADRALGKLVVNGYWPEEDFSFSSTFEKALAAAFRRLFLLLGISSLDLSPLPKSSPFHTLAKRI